MLIFKQKLGLKKTLSSVFSNLQKSKKVSLRMCKKVSLALYNKGLIDASWTKKPALDILVQLADKGPMLSILINNQPTSCILDTGSTFTLIPFPKSLQTEIKKVFQT